MSVSTVKLVQKNQGTCSKCGCKTSEISSGKLYDKFGCGICRDIKRKLTPLAIGLLGITDLHNEILAGRIKEIFGEDVSIEVSITTSDGNTVKTALSNS
jgi:hypothetical protein